MFKMNLSLSLYKNHANPHVLGVKNAYIFRIVNIHHKVRFFYYETVANIAIKFLYTKKNKVFFFTSGHKIDETAFFHRNCI
jgi:hypothetical protein